MQLFIHPWERYESIFLTLAMNRIVEQTVLSLLVEKTNLRKGKTVNLNCHPTLLLVIKYNMSHVS